MLPHKYKISFYKGTVVTRINPFDNNVDGFIFEHFNWLLDGTRHYHEHEAVDVIRSTVAVGDVVHVQSTAGRKIRRIVVIEDAKKVDVVESKASSSSGKSEVTFYCEEHSTVYVASSQSQRDLPRNTSLDRVEVLEHQSDAKVFTMTMEILLEPTSNKLLVDSYKMEVPGSSLLKDS
uniref:Uncharacterized protein n=1 Tax=Tanacetum cinerariifolium TaxID=118510 RepID=A0A6L2KVC0_TANCI|nr:hypothetical protein [Tanacetum cinerariifolium]